MPPPFVIRSLTVFTLLAGLAASTLQAQAPPARLTMGSLVMMRVNGDAGVNDAIGAALSHPEPGMRAVAARLVGVGRVTALRPPLSTALRSEKNEAVAAEQARALLLLGGTRGVEELDAYLVTGAPPPVAVAYALHLARHEPQLFVDRLPRLITAVGEGRATELAPAIELLGSQHVSHVEVTWRTWLTHAPSRAWSSVLSRYKTPPSEVVLLDALLSDDVVVRETTVWFVATWVGRGVAVPEAILEAMHARPDESAWEGFGRELVARKVRNATRTNRSDLVRAQPPEKRSDLAAIDLSDMLLPEEQLAIDAVLGERPTRAGVLLPVSDELPLMRTPENLWPGFFTSLAEETRCRRGPWAFGAVGVTYALDGRPMALTVDRGDLSEACGRFATALGHVTLIHPATPLKSGAVQWLLVPTAREFFACVDAPRPDLGLPRPTTDPDWSSGAIQQPRKSRNVPPRYPRDAQERRVSGVVVLEAVISRDGCISSAHTLRSIDPFLAMEAMRAVLQWRYTPPQLNGTPVDVIMTATVNFALN